VVIGELWWFASIKGSNRAFLQTNRIAASEVRKSLKDI
jgi:hypothetical protein